MDRFFQERMPTLAVKKGGSVVVTSNTEYFGHVMVTSGASLVVSQGGRVRNITNSGGSAVISYGGSAQIDNGFTAKGITVLHTASSPASGGLRTLWSPAGGAVLDSCVLDSNGAAYVEHLGSFTNGTISSGHLYLSASTYASNVTCSNGSVTLNGESAFIQSSLITYNGNMVLQDGTVASGISVTGNGAVTVSQGGVCRDLYTSQDPTIRNRTPLTVASGGTAVNVSGLGQGGCAISNGGLLSSALYQGVSSGGTVYWPGIGIYGTATDITAHSQATVYAQSGGTVIRGTAESGGFIRAQAYGTISSASAIDSTALVVVSSGGTGKQLLAKNGGIAWIQSGGQASNVIASHSGGLVSASGAQIIGITQVGTYPPASVFLNQTIASNITETHAVLRISGGTTTSVTGFGGSLLLCSGASVSELNITGGPCTVNISGFSSGGVSTYVSGVTFNLASGNFYMNYSATDSTNKDKAHAENVVLSCAGGNATIKSGAQLDQVTLTSSAVLHLSGGKIRNLTVTSGGSANVTFGGMLYTLVTNKHNKVQSGIINVIGGNCSYVDVSAGGTLTLSSGYANYAHTSNSGGGAAVVDIWPNGRVQVLQGGVAGAVIISGTSQLYGVLAISSGGRAVRVSASTFGKVYIYESATIDSGSAYAPGAAIAIYSSTCIDSLLSNCSAYAGGRLYVRGRGIAGSALWVGSGGGLYVWQPAAGSNVSAVNCICCSGGYINVYNGGILVSASVRDNGSYLYVLSGGVVSEVSALSTGRLLLSSGATAQNCSCGAGGIIGCFSYGSFMGGAVDNTGVLYANGYTSGTTVLSGGTAIVSTGATASSLQISSGGRLVVSSAGTALKVVSKTGAIVTSVAGAVITYA